MAIVEHVTLEHYMEVCLNGIPKKGARSARANERSSRNDEPDHSEWTGTKSWDYCAELAVNGWPEGRNQVGDILAQIETRESEVIKPQVVWDVYGDYVDVGVYMTGQPECMVRWEQAPDVKRVARIAANISVSAGVSTKVMQWQGACCLALVDRLESQGIRAEVDFVFGITSYSNSEPRFVIVNAKRAEDSLALDSLAFHLVNPSSLRRMMFSYVECSEPHLVNSYGTYAANNYGTPLRDLESALNEAGQHYDLVMPSLHLDDVDKAVAQVEKLFNKVCNVERLYQGAV